ncbi:hypothetical protein OHC33_007207 [Knufia fluminis]|uniref:Uncharacterized protein n=1 Tax=Knufia fluminis TaxID=191047 RepID=A0AAN8EBZ7_9EURO|nr:hypothetical protein OHC33_007207 [Knufia fluminis]
MCRRNKILEDKRRMEDEIETARGIQGVNVFYMSDISEDEDTGAAPSGDSNDQHDRPDRAVTPPSPTISNFSVDIHAEGSNEDSQIGAAYEKLPYQNNTVTATAPELTMNENKPATQQLHNGAAYQGELNVNQVQEQRSENIPSEVPTLQLSRAMGSDSAHDIQPSQAEAGSRLPAVALPSSVNKPLGLAQQTSRMLPPNGFAIQQNPVATTSQPLPPPAPITPSIRFQFFPRGKKNICHSAPIDELTNIITLCVRAR